MFWGDKGVSEAVYKAICNDQLVLGDSDTVLGLYAAVSAAGKVLLDDIKGRSGKPYVVLTAHARRAMSFIDDKGDSFPQNLLKKIMDTCWPGPLTLVCTARRDIPGYARSELGTIALRVPLHDGLQRLLALTDGIFSTSANKSGEVVPDSIDQVAPYLLAQIGCIVLNKPGVENLSEAQPSTIIDCTGLHVRLIREGAYAVTRLEKELGISIT